MKNILAVAAVVSLMSPIALASTKAMNPGVYGPMHVVDAEYDFKKVTSDVTLTLAYDNNKPVMTLDYLRNGNPEHVSLEVYRSESDACGAEHVYAQLPNESNPNGPRYNVHFVDNTSNNCDAVRSWSWEASVRKGFGWCGTGDSTMTLQGNAY